MLSPDDRCSAQSEQEHAVKGGQTKEATASDQSRRLCEEAVPVSLKMDHGVRTRASGMDTKSCRVSGREMR